MSEKNIGLRTFTVLLTEIFQVSRNYHGIDFLDTPFHVRDTTSNYLQLTFVLSVLIILVHRRG